MCMLGFRVYPHQTLVCVCVCACSPGSDWMDAFLKAAQASFFQMTPTEMSNIVWALAKLGHKLPPKWLDSFLMVAQVGGGGGDRVGFKPGRTQGWGPCFVCVHSTGW